MMVVKRIMRYLKGIEDYGLYYKKNEKFELKAYIDADWAGNIDEKKVQVVELSFWEIDLYLGLVRSKTVSHNPL